ncbi:MAG: hypothetical protein CMN78_05530 [Spirochaetales bacterium]|nr:hypothetical protein [Spirochaetales bacterium]
MTTAEYLEVHSRLIERLRIIAKSWYRSNKRLCIALAIGSDDLLQIVSMQILAAPPGKANQYYFQVAKNIINNKLREARAMRRQSNDPIRRAKIENLNAIAMDLLGRQVERNEFCKTF